MRLPPLLVLIGLILISIASAGANDSAPIGPVVRLPNRTDYWQSQGFQEMVAPLRLPTNSTRTDTIQVWLKIPDQAQLTAQPIYDGRENRDTLVYPPGTIADRVEFDADNDNRVGDVRGARIDGSGNTLFHVYEASPGADVSWLLGYEWPRGDDQRDVTAGEALVSLYGSDWSESEKNHFRSLNHCANCHLANAPAPLTTAAPFRYESDSRGFFQPITVLQSQVVVRNHRSWDLNADDPFISVWCGSERTYAVTDGGSRGYQCADDTAPVGRLDVARALSAGDSQATRMCAARAYLYRHMDGSARAAFGAAFTECGILY